MVAVTSAGGGNEIGADFVGQGKAPPSSCRVEPQDAKPLLHGDKEAPVSLHPADSVEIRTAARNCPRKAWQLSGDGYVDAVVVLRLFHKAGSPSSLSPPAGEAEWGGRIEPCFS